MQTDEDMQLDTTSSLDQPQVVSDEVSEDRRIRDLLDTEQNTKRNLSSNATSRRGNRKRSDRKSTPQNGERVSTPLQVVAAAVKEVSAIAKIAVKCLNPKKKKKKKKMEEEEEDDFEELDIELTNNNSLDIKIDKEEKKKKIAKTKHKKKIASKKMKKVIEEDESMDEKDMYKEEIKKKKKKKKKTKAEREEERRKAKAAQEEEASLHYNANIDDAVLKTKEKKYDEALLKYHEIATRNLPSGTITPQVIRDIINCIDQAPPTNRAEVLVIRMNIIERIIFHFKPVDTAMEILIAYHVLYVSLLSSLLGVPSKHRRLILTITYCATALVLLMKIRKTRLSNKIVMPSCVKPINK